MKSKHTYTICKFERFEPHDRASTRLLKHRNAIPLGIKYKTERGAFEWIRRNNRFDDCIVKDENGNYAYFFVNQQTNKQSFAWVSEFLDLDNFIAREKEIEDQIGEKIGLSVFK